MKANSNNRPREAFTLVELMVVMLVLAVLGLFVLPAILPVSRCHARPARINCVNNLKQVGLAFRTWALDHNDKYPTQISVTNGGVLEFMDTGAASLLFRPLSNELSTPKIMVCPADKKRKTATGFGSVFDDQHLSYFLGLDAVPANPQTFLAGDWNITNGVPRKGRFLNLTTNEPAGWTDELHSLHGNVGLADGSVQQFSRSKLQEAIGWTGAITNRLVMP